MRSIMKRAFALTAATTVAVLAAPVSPANAHGEAAQESFLRMGTVAFINTTWEGIEVENTEADGDITTLQSGDTFSVSGITKILDVWPAQLGEPEMGFISIVSPGPVVLVKDRLVNGRPTPAAFEVETGGVYTYEMTLQARRPGKWHIHPIFGVQKAGSLLGPGLYVNIEGSLDNFENKITLVNGDVVDLEKVGMGGLWFWNIVWTVLGMIWLLYWIVPKPTVTRLPVNLQIPLNTDGEIYGLITKKDHRVSDMIMLVTLILTIGGMIYQGQKYPDKIPQQVLRYEPPKADVADFASAQGVDATFNADTDTVEFPVSITNEGDSAITVVGFTATNYNWAPGDELHPLTVEGTNSIAPGETATVTLVMKDKVWSSQRLMPLGESRLQISGVVIVENAAGEQSYETAQAFVRSTAVV